MGHTHTNLLYHGVFSTKQRRPLLNTDILPELTKVVGGILARRKGKLLAFNGTENHVHLLGSFHPTLTVSDMFRDIKAVSSDWIHDRFSSGGAFAWQAGYSVFTVGKANVESVLNYIANQQEHHRRKTFEEELLEMLERAGVAYESKYVLD